MKSLIEQTRVGALLAVVTILLLGGVYPLLVTAVARIAFPYQAAGSMVRLDGRVVGSAIVGECWTGPGFLHGRPSASSYDPTATGGTNLAPTSAVLIAQVRQRIARLRRDNPHAVLPLPIDLVTASGSGIDPDVSPAAAYYQAPRIAAARGVSVARIDAVIAHAVRPRTLGILGEPRVNVLAVNLALAALHPRPGAPARSTRVRRRRAAAARTRCAA